MTDFAGPAERGPGVTGPDVTGPGVTGPGATGPGATGSRVPGASRPGDAAGWPPPAPGAAPLARMIRAEAGLELRFLLRNGEQLLLTLIIPVLLLLAFGHEPLVAIHGSRIDFVVPGILALAVLSTAFTSQAISTGFERRYGVLKRLGATPLSRGGLIGAKTLTVLAVEVLQVVIICALGAVLGWRPDTSPAGVAFAVALLLAGTAAFSGLALLLAGTLRAEATLAAANLIYLVMLGIGGVLFPLARFPAGIRPELRLLPAGALADGLRATLAHGGGLPGLDLLVLLAWAVAAIAIAARTFRWE
ncbi:ABC transporter permease [Mycobacterium sp.]|uniref:ABC transporter permease n=1 Tax=Mycobacterium sp. TaxID=1785 RepID=UPI003D6BD0E1